MTLKTPINDNSKHDTKTPINNTTYHDAKNTN